MAVAVGGVVVVLVGDKDDNTVSYSGEKAFFVGDMFLVRERGLLVGEERGLLVGEERLLVGEGAFLVGEVDVRVAPLLLDVTE